MTIEEMLRLEEENINIFKQQHLSENTPFSSGKILSHVDRIYHIKHVPQETKPITLELHLTNACQHKCPSCMYKDRQQNKHLELDKALEILRDCHRLGVKGIVYSGGGEPLLYPFIDEVMGYGTSLGMKQGLITNGGLLDRHTNSVAENCDWVRVSLDAGSSEIRMKTHGASDYEQTINNIKKLVLKKNKKQRIGVSFLLTAFNFLDVFAATHTAKELGLDYIQIKPMIMSHEEKIATKNILWDKKIPSLLNASFHQKTDNFKVYILWQQFLGNIDGHKGFNKCHGHALYPVITASGDIFVCCMQIGNKARCYGNITDTSFLNLWKTKRRFSIGSTIDIAQCPKLCRLGQTNTLLQNIFNNQIQDPDFLN